MKFEELEIEPKIIQVLNQLDMMKCFRFKKK